MKKTNIYYDSHDQFYKSKFGAIEFNEEFQIRIKTKTCLEVYSVFIHIIDEHNINRKLQMDFESCDGEDNIYKISVKAPASGKLLWYYFEVFERDQIYYYGNNHEEYGGVGESYECNPKHYQITLYKRIHEIPKWYRESIMYQIFVDRFNRGENHQEKDVRANSFLYSDWYDTPTYLKNTDGSIKRWEFFGGDLYGIIEKLDYLKELNVTCIYLNPIFDAPSNHKYDTSDYKKIDFMFGGLEAFEKLVEECDKRGMKLILDGVFSHTGSDSIYFNRYRRFHEVGAYESKRSPYYPWYKFTNYPDEYESWWGVKSLPELNELDPGYMDFIIRDKNSVLKKWLKKGIGGWRLDVADELPDEFIREFKKQMKETNEDTILIGEVWEDASNKRSYGELRSYFQGEELDGVMNYTFREVFIDFFNEHITGYQLGRNVMKYFENYPLDNFYANMNIIGSHDVCRILTVLGDAPIEHNMSINEKENYKMTSKQRRLGIDRSKLMSLVQMTFMGVPCIYYGDEAGLEGYSDPYNRKTYPWKREDQELISWYKFITKLRDKYDALKTGFWKQIYVGEEVYAYLRYTKDGKDVFGEEKQEGDFLIIVNRSKDQKVYLDINLEEYNDYVFKDLVDDAEFKVSDKFLNVELEPLQGRVLMCKY